MTWNEEVAFGPPTPKKIRTVSPTFAFIGCSAVRTPIAPLKTKYSGLSARSFSTLNSSPAGSTKVSPHLPLVMRLATIGVAQ